MMVSEWIVDVTNKAGSSFSTIDSDTTLVPLLAYSSYVRPIHTNSSSESSRTTTFYHHESRKQYERIRSETRGVDGVGIGGT